DSFVRDGDNEDDNFGTAGTLVVKEDSDDKFDRRAFLRWDLGSIRGKVVHAKVRLMPVFVGEPDIENAASVVIATPWSETDVTWKNQPLAGHRFASWIAKDSTPVEFNVTTEVQEALSNDHKLTVRLHSVRDVGDSGGVDYASRENGNASFRPMLFVTVTNSKPVVTVDT